jgi:hypothetical protein
MSNDNLSKIAKMTRVKTTDVLYITLSKKFLKT